MLFKRKIVERYVIGAILPYLGLSLLLLTAALLAHQATRFAEVLGTARSPLDLAFEVLVHIIPNILVFTIPTATLFGTIIGFSQMSSDSELIAMHAAGVGRLRIVIPVLLLGCLMSLGTFYISFFIAPESAQKLRRIASTAALRKLESPVEPRTFYTETPGKVLYVREGDLESGEWGRVFIYWKEQGDAVRLVTARSGRIDSTGEQVELVLSDAEVISLPGLSSQLYKEDQPITVESSSTLRMRDERLDEGRKALLKRIDSREKNPDDLSWSELSAQIKAQSDPQALLQMMTLYHRRLAVCFAPFVFSLFGAGLGVKTKRGGRGLGILISIITLLLYYLLTMGGGNMVRSGLLPLFIGAWLANLLMLSFGILLLVGSGFLPSLRIIRGRNKDKRLGRRRESALYRTRIRWGLMDRLVLRSLCWSFSLAFLLLLTVFIVFTLFDLLRFVNADRANWGLIARYLFFVLPYAGNALAPMGLLVGVLTTYALMARRSETVAWWASGQSAFRLIVPGVSFALFVGACMWLLQEEVLPQANRIQNALRGQIRGGAQAESSMGRQWLATTDMRRIYAYTFEAKREELLEPVLFEFDGAGVELQRIVIGERGRLAGGGGIEIQKASEVRLGAGIQSSFAEKLTTTDEFALLKPQLNRPDEKSFKQLSEDLKRAAGQGDASARMLAVSLERKRSEPFSPLVLALSGIPLALLFGKRSAVAALSVAVLVGMVFWAATSGAFYMGVRGLLPVAFAAWAPLTIFAALGFYLLARTDT